MANYLYIYEGLLQRRYGEIQGNYNMSIVCDGTKDSCKVVVYNFERKEIDPITICYLEDTKTWWIVQSDKVIRHATENNASGYYEHTISLVGAFEILNYRDMINCGFNVNKYTYTQFFERLAKMFDFELPIEWDIGNYIDMGQKVSYLKTFQNYTPASAIKEMFNGMNLVPKLKFDETEQVLTYATIYAVPKSGLNQTIINGETFFDNEEEQSSSNAESFGSRVVSNVENCVSADSVRYPIFGGTRLISEDTTVNYDNGFIRLPSNIYSLKDLTIYASISISVIQGSTTKGQKVWLCNQTKDELKNIVNNLIGATYQSDIDYINNNWDTIYESIKSNSYCVFQNGGEYHKVSNSYNDKVVVWDASQGTSTHGMTLEIFVNDKKHGTSAVYEKTPFQCMLWEQGKDKVENFGWLSAGEHLTRPQGQQSIIIYNLSNTQLSFSFNYVADLLLNIQPLFSVNYVPMGDLKVKVDNRIDKNDSNLYNQNGKLIDAKSVSKLINSYAKEISSNEITRNKTFYNFASIPLVGSLVNLYDDIYIINNISYDFYENEYLGTKNHYIECQFTMTKAVACKSTMISANTNIRDYDCPQQNNVPRIQTYRDYFELGYVGENDHNETRYLKGYAYLYDEIFNFNLTYPYFTKDSNKGLFEDYACFIDIDNGYSYVIHTTKYNLNKQNIVLVNLKDNNIIGYEAGERYYTLQISKWLDWLSNYTTVNTPINYVDDNGECTSIELYLITSNAMQEIYIGNEERIGKSVSIPYEFITDTEQYQNYSLKINEYNYDKDGLEVPVFEYCCEVGDNNGIVFGENFLKGEKIENTTDILYYTITRFPSNEIITQENGTKYRNALGGSFGVIDDPVDIYYDNTNYLLKIYIDSNRGVNIGDNFVINMLGCNKDLDISHGFFNETMLFGVNKCKVATTNETLHKKFNYDFTIAANQRVINNFNLGHYNMIGSCTYKVYDSSGNLVPSEQISVSTDFISRVGKVGLLTFTIRKLITGSFSGRVEIDFGRTLPTLTLKVNNWKLK